MLLKVTAVALGAAVAGASGEDGTRGSAGATAHRAGRWSDFRQHRFLSNNKNKKKNSSKEHDHQHDPTPEPTRSSSVLRYKGNGLSHGSYARCEGDCDSDDDCFGDLVCFQRTALEPVPGCEGTLYSSLDYCIDAKDVLLTSVTLPAPTTRRPSRAPSRRPTGVSNRTSSSMGP